MVRCPLIHWQLGEKHCHHGSRASLAVSRTASAQCIVGVFNTQTQPFKESAFSQALSLLFFFPIWKQKLLYGSTVAKVYLLWPLAIHYWFKSVCLWFQVCLGSEVQQHYQPLKLQVWIEMDSLGGKNEWETSRLWYEGKLRERLQSLVSKHKSRQNRLFKRGGRYKKGQSWEFITKENEESGFSHELDWFILPIFFCDIIPWFDRPGNWDFIYLNVFQTRALSGWHMPAVADFGAISNRITSWVSWWDAQFPRALLFSLEGILVPDAM